jgi:hypothetical protein
MYSRSGKGGKGSGPAISGKTKRPGPSLPRKPRPDVDPKRSGRKTIMPVRPKKSK